MINHKIFDRTSSKIFESPIMNVKITGATGEIREQKEYPPVIEETDDEEL